MLLFRFPATLDPVHTYAISYLLRNMGHWYTRRRCMHSLRTRCAVLRWRHVLSDSLNCDGPALGRLLRSLSGQGPIPGEPIMYRASRSPRVASYHETNRGTFVPSRTRSRHATATNLWHVDFAVLTFAMLTFVMLTLTS